MSLIDRVVRRPTATHAEAATALHEGVWVYHRAGCPFCLRLGLALGRRAREARWIDIWADTDAAAYVRSVNGGDETVPTVVVDGVATTNPPPGEVRAALAARRRL